MTSPSRSGVDSNAPPGSVRIALALVCALLVSSCEGDAAQPGKDATPSNRRPNILLLLADDLGNNDIHVNNGAPDIKTPNMDALAAAGTRFTRFYTESTCTPSRVALLTGRYAARAGFRPTGRGIPPERTTLPEALRTEGYATHHVGKWHVGSTVKSAWPLAQGFDTSFGFLNQWRMRAPEAKRDVGYPTYHDPWLQTNNQPRRQHFGHLTDLLTDHTVGLIEGADRSKPWFVYHAYFAPHTPIEPADRFASRHPDTPEGKFKALLEQLDASVGRIMESLRETGQLENTIVVFASDNGGLNQARDNNAPYFGTKNTYWEGGVRVPLVIRWPKRFAPGESFADPVAIFDLYPTLLDLAGITNVPDDLDGVSLAQTPPPAVLATRHLFWENFVFNRAVYAVLTPTNERLIHELGGKSTLLDLDENPTGKPESRIDAVDRIATIRERYETWRSDTRTVATTWTALSEDGHGVLTGDDFQRSPGMAGFSFAIGVVPKAQDDEVPTQQIIAYQHNHLVISLEPDGRVQVDVDGKVLESEPLAKGTCHSIIFSGFFNRRQSPLFLRRPRPSVLNLFVDGEFVDLDSSTRPLPPLADLRAPTFIGRDHLGHRTFRGQLRNPTIFNQALMSKDNDSSPGIGPVERELCSLDPN